MWNAVSTLSLSSIIYTLKVNVKKMIVTKHWDIVEILQQVAVLSLKVNIDAQDLVCCLYYKKFYGLEEISWVLALEIQ